MLEFDESFFVGEELDGFYVEEDMKRAWAAQLEVLTEIDRICKKYGIQWYAEYGTLLGAVRHKRFIPWDDDMDISMKRPDYEKFMSVVQRELPQGWSASSARLDEQWSQPFMRVVNGSGINISKEFLERFHGCPYTVGIDIFPLDYITPDKAQLEVIQFIYQYVVYVRDLLKEKVEDGKKEVHRKKIEEALCNVEKTLCFKINREANVVNQMLRRLDDLSSLYQEQECDDLGILCYMYPNTKKQRSKKWYDEVVFMPFENIEMPVPKEWDAVLNASYDNYKVQVCLMGEHYPFYASQKKQVQEILERVKRINEKMDNLETSIGEKQ